MHINLKELPVFPDYDDDAVYSTEFILSMLGKYFVGSDGVTLIFVPDDERNRDYAAGMVFPEYISYDADIRDMNLHGGIH